MVRGEEQQACSFNQKDEPQAQKKAKQRNDKQLFSIRIRRLQVDKHATPIPNGSIGS